MDHINKVILHAEVMETFQCCFSINIDKRQYMLYQLLNQPIRVLAFLYDALLILGNILLFFQRLRKLLDLGLQGGLEFRKHLFKMIYVFNLAELVQCFRIKAPHIFFNNLN